MERTRDPSVARAKPSAKHSPFNILEDEEEITKERQRRRQAGEIDEIDEDDPIENEDDYSSGDSDDSEDQRKALDPMIQEDISRFEESFKGITKRYKVLSRIGEGASPSPWIKAQELR